MHENLQEMIKEVTKDPNPVNVEGMEPEEKKAKENGSKKKKVMLVQLRQRFGEIRKN